MAVIIALYIVASVLWFPFAWLMPQIWPTGPVALIHPGYWMFVLAIFVLRVMVNLIFRKVN